MFLDRPWFGVGFGRFRDAKLPYLDDRTVNMNLNSIREYVHHNTFLSVLTETGLLGLGAFSWLLLAWTHRASALWRDRHRPEWARSAGLLFCGVLTVAAWQMLAHEITFTPVDNGLIFLLAGVVVSVSSRVAAYPLSPVHAADWRPMTCRTPA
jgi:O-antigen ligase